ncbi:hypothetical protein [Streptomyces sp. NPDC050560]|uniref:hypothetical protein n=1 Tax=Streptomyces sp. NPDC050560 TaxID=3365630 RepID=UPI003795A285
MAQISWPAPGHNDRAVTDSEYEEMAARWSDDGVYGAPTDAPVVAAGAGLAVTVRADVQASLRGHAWTSGDSDLTLTVAANSSGSTRTDRVVLRLNRDDWTVTAAVKQGTPGSGAPLLTQALGASGVYEISLARVTVPTGASSVSVTRAELYVGGRFRPCTSTTLPEYAGIGDGVVETDTGRVRIYAPGGWRTISSSSDGTISIDSPLSAWSIETESVIEVRNGLVTMRLGSFERAAGTLGASTSSRLPALIPSAYRHATRDQYIVGYVTGVEVCRMTLYSRNTDMPGQIWLTQKPSIANGDHVLATSGVTWVVAD